MIPSLSESGITFVPLFVPLQLLTEKDLNSLCCKFTPGMVRLDILAVSPPHTEAEHTRPPFGQINFTDHRQH